MRSSSDARGQKRREVERREKKGSTARDSIQREGTESWDGRVSSSGQKLQIFRVYVKI